MGRAGPQESRPLLRACCVSILAVAVLCSTPLTACDRSDLPGDPAPAKAMKGWVTPPLPKLARADESNG